MKSRILTAALAAVVLAAPLAATPEECIPDKECKEGQKPPACCDKPPCQVLEYLKQMIAARRFFTGDAPEIVLRDNLNDHSKAMKRLSDLTQQEWAEPKYGSQCLPAGLPRFRLSSDCDLQVAGAGGWRSVTTSAEATREAAGCRETADAHYEFMKRLQATCDPSRPEADVRNYAVRMRNALDQAIGAMQAELGFYWQICSTPDNPWLKNELSDLGIDTDTELEKARMEAILESIRQGAKAPGKVSRGGR